MWLDYYYYLNKTLVYIYNFYIKNMRYIILILSLLCITSVMGDANSDAAASGGSTAGA